jgi:NADH-quinone oxidoreductase subunit N
MSPSQALDSFFQTTLFLLPELVLLAAAIVIMTASCLVERPRRFWCAASAAAMVVALLLLVSQSDRDTSAYATVAVNDSLSTLARALILLTGLVVLGLAHEEPSPGRAGEFFGALLMINAGAMLVAAANEIVFLFVGLELVSIPTYLLLYLSRRDQKAQEAATKYFYLSIFASGLLLYGLALLYGTTGVGNLKAIAVLYGRLNMPQPELGFLAAVFILAGLCFKVAAVPLHFYAPDVYEGSPTVIAALLSWVPKAVGFLAIVRTLTAVLAAKDTGDPLMRRLVAICWIIAAATMIWGNFVGLLQTNLRRLMAYSSIAHAGYMMVGVTAAFADDQHGGTLYRGSESVIFYLVTYALMTLGAFGAFVALRTEGRPVQTIDDLAGIGWTKPYVALALAVCLLSLSGIPPLAGFWGKLEIFASLIPAGQGDNFSAFVLLGVIGLLSAAAGAFYYLRLVVTMYLRPAVRAVDVGGGWPVFLAVAACAGLTVIVGLYSSPFSQAAHAAAASALDHPAPAQAEIAAIDVPQARPNRTMLSH